MAGLASGTLLEPPLLCRLKLKPSSLQPSTLFGLRFSSPTLKFNSSLSLSSSSSYSVAVSARFGGYRPDVAQDDDDDDDDGDYDEGLDLSSVRSDTVRLIDEEQNMVGVVSKSEAISRAEEAELDLAYHCGVTFPDDLSRMLLPGGRLELKELKMGHNIGIHDYSVRFKAAQKFLKEGHKLKVIVNLKGHQTFFLRQAIELIRKFQNDLGELAIEERNSFSRRKPADITERTIYMILSPNRSAAQKHQDASKKKGSLAANEVSASV
ncbi:hypothetical protein Cgig2_019971 [Carnegiea gigantea]|uniref:Translation initiation factor IF-3 n=1 Tax=Carnegiea gigantea TaxID=171969 RepID=A0A9Q1K065_9CARY|nr:hypothetical protein Cgig2_019971 [Carnegiea gigantea]